SEAPTMSSSGPPPAVLTFEASKCALIMARAVSSFIERLPSWRSLVSGDGGLEPRLETPPPFDGDRGGARPASHRRGAPSPRRQLQVLLVLLRAVVPAGEREDHRVVALELAERARGTSV